MMVHALAYSLFFSGAVPGPHESGLLGDLPRLKDFTAARHSSYDRTGGNMDGGQDEPIQPGETRTIADMDGAGAITHIWMTIFSKDPNHLKSFVVRMYWDGEETPSVESPLGDFFGLGHGRYYQYSCLPIQIGTDRGLNCFWRMPYSNGARITVTNDGPIASRAFYYYIDYQKLPDLPPDTGRFHAQYRQAYPPTPGENYVFLEASGRGHYVGCNLSIHNRAAGWWGEGDDMFYIDGEKRPSLHGTGSEDYFCGAWSYGKPFSNPYFGCPLIEGRHEQNALWNVYRYHLEDPVPFKESIRVTMEHGHANNRNDDFSSVAYWYQTEPHVPFPPFPAPETRLPSEATVFTEAWVEEVEDMAGAFDSDQVVEQSMLEFGNLWSRGKQLLFRATGPAVYQAQSPIEPGDAGIHDLELWYTAAPNYGRVELWLNGEQICQWDGYSAEGPVRKKWESTHPIRLLREGNTVEVRIVGKNPASSGFYAGWDCFRLRERLAWWEISGAEQAAMQDNGPAGQEPDNVITTATLIDEMTDMERLTRYPEPFYKNIQFTSYDRQSSVPGAKNWFANSDGFGEEPVPNFEAVLKQPEGDAPGQYLICDVEGPGAIVRLWTAQIAGSLEVFLDGSETPLYQGPAEQFFRYPYETFLEGTGLEAETVARAFYQRDASYAPIPFARRCRIVWTGNPHETHFYAVQMRKYEADAHVITFSPAGLGKAAENIRRVASAFGDEAAEGPFTSVKAPISIAVDVEPHSIAQGALIEGGCAIGRLTLKVDAPDIDEALRKTVMHIQCDEYPWGQVQAPIGDFFGAGPGINPYESAAFSVSPDGTMVSRFLMPCKESIRLSFDNRGDQRVTITGSVLPVEYTWDERSMYFFARWRADHGLVASDNEASMGAQDIPFLMARGQGVYVGTAIMLLNPSKVPTPHGGWWGEGDEKIFVDDERFPSLFGTGTEDYFNYSWSATDLFAFPYCGQPRNDGPGNRGFVSNYRWHIVDPVPYRSSIAFYMELFSHERTEGFSYARLSYHYAKEGMMDDHLPITDEDLRMPRLPENWQPAPRFGAAGLVFLGCENCVADEAAVELVRDNRWQGGQAIVWTPDAAGDELSLRFEVPEDGEYNLVLTCMFQPEGGAFRATLDGNAIAFGGKDITVLTAPHHVLSRMLGTRAGQLKAGTHVLKLTAEEAGKHIGLDFLGYGKRGQ